MRDRSLCWCRWAVSQASPLRRLLVTENLKLYEYRGGGAAGYASGGFLGNSVVKGIVVSGSCHLALPWLCVSILTSLHACYRAHQASGSQQQWITRSSNIAGWVEGVWNMVFVGVEGSPTPHCGQDIKLCQNPYVVVPEAPIVAEKPFISVESAILPSCRVQLLGLCARAKLASKGNCFICTGTHALQMRHAQCQQNDFEVSKKSALSINLHLSFAARKSQQRIFLPADFLRHAWPDSGDGQVLAAHSHAAAQQLWGRHP